MNIEITEAVYAFIKQYIQQYGYAPSLREIASGCYLGTSSVLRHLDRLEAWGRLARDPGRARSMRLMSQSSEAEPTLGMEDKLSAERK